tara:strand:+ start:1100 stop:1540 length:441 start_codon:yes stop_codon:yes gene_type:complete
MTNINNKVSSPSKAVGSTTNKATGKIPMPSGGSGSLNLNSKVWVSDEFYSSGCSASLPKQLATVLTLVVNEFGGSCTLKQLDELWQASEYLDVNGGKYTQGIQTRLGQKSFWTHYVSGTSFTNKITERKASVQFGIDNYAKYIKIS